MRSSLFAYTAAALLSASLAAHATPIVFDVHLFPGADQLSGSVTIDTTTGLFTALNLVESGTAISSAADVNFANENTQVQGSTSYIQLQAGTYLVLSGANTLKGYAGGSFDFYGLFPDQGTLNPEAAPTAVTPEPSSLALLSTGLLGVAGIIKRRFV